jgi:hypothetical protein
MSIALFHRYKNLAQMIISSDNIDVEEIKEMCNKQ